MMRRILTLGIIVLAVCVIGCSETTGTLPQTLGGDLIEGKVMPLPSVDYSRYGKPRIPVRILLLIPSEFELFEFTSRYQERNIRHKLGLEAEHELRTAFGIEFSEVRVHPVASEANARDMLHPRHAENSLIQAYDFTVIPRFLKVDSSAENEDYRFSIDLVAEFTAPDGSSITITGHGESTTGKYTVSTPEKSARLTLQVAVSAILDRIEKNRSFFDK